MPRDRSSVAVYTGEDAQEVAKPGPDTPFHILVAGDFTGGAGRGRKAIPVDRDSLNNVMGALAPAIEVPLAGTSLKVDFYGTGDFHPDRLLERLAPFQHLVELRRRLADSSTFAAAAAEVLPSTENPSVHIPPAPGNLSGSDLLRLMMGEEPVEESQRTGWDQLLGRIAESYAVPAPDPRQPEIISQVDAAIGQQMRAVLHHPAFQALESNWRALEFLVRRVETCTNLKISLLDLPRQELLSEAGIATLRRALAEDARAIIALMYYFSADEESLLLRFAALARSGRAPILTGLAPEIVGLDGVFGELRRASDARWIGFALPRFLLRLPYGRDTQEIDAVPFEEMPSPPEHQCYLWGHPAAACACLLGQTFSRYGWALRPGAINTIGDLPVHVYHADGETQLKPCAEILLTDEAAGLLLNRGFIPLVSAKGSDEVRIPIFQSVADPSAPLAGRWTR